MNLFRAKTCISTPVGILGERSYKNLDPDQAKLNIATVDQAQTDPL